MATVITTNDLIAMDPNRATTDAPTLARYDLFIQNAEFAINEDVWGPRYKMAVLYAALHALQLADLASGQFVTSEKVGDITKTYAVMGAAGSAGDWERTVWGLLYLQLRRTLAAGPLVV